MTSSSEAERHDDDGGKEAEKRETTKDDGGNDDEGNDDASRMERQPPVEEAATGVTTAAATRTQTARQSSSSPVRKEDFVIGDTIGEGSFSYVVRARRRESGEDVAMKVMNKQQIVRENKVKYVKNERDVLGQIDHVGVVRMLFTFQDASSLFVGMELAEGGELFQQLRERKAFPAELARFYAAELADVLEYLHVKIGCVHRDLKPENILLTRDGHIKLADFGSSKLITKPNAEAEAASTEGPHPGGDKADRVAGDAAPADGSRSRTMSNGDAGDRRPSRRAMSFVGTAEYVSPEVLQGTMGEITVAADLWALGCIVFQMLVGRPPFRGESEYLTFQKVVNRDFGEVPDDLSDDANTLIDALLQVVPGERLGAGEGGYGRLKAHPFFEGTRWESLWTDPPPLPPLPPSEASFSERNVGDLTAELDEVIEKSKTIAVAGAGAASENGAEVRELKGKQKWMQFCEEGEAVLRYGMTRKHRGLLPKKRELILTDRPRLIYVDPGPMTVKGEITISAEMSVRVKDDNFFTISVPGRDYKMEDIGGDAQGWADAIQDAKVQSLGMSAASPPAGGGDHPRHVDD